MPLDPVQTIFLGIRAEALPARYSINDAPTYNAGSQRPVYKAIRTDTAELVACTKIPKSSLHTLDSVQALQQVGYMRSFPLYIGVISIVGGGLTLVWRCRALKLTVS